MTAKQKKYIAKQLEIIQKKRDDEGLNHYAASLSVAKLNKKVKHFLTRAVDVRKDELNPISAMVVDGDLDDFEGE